MPGALFIAARPTRVFVGRRRIDKSISLLVRWLINCRRISRSMSLLVRWLIKKCLLDLF
jgi:hypothetical protein